MYLSGGGDICVLSLVRSTSTVTVRRSGIGKQVSHMMCVYLYTSQVYLFTIVLVWRSLTPGSRLLRDFTVQVQTHHFFVGSTDTVIFFGSCDCSRRRHRYGLRRHRGGVWSWSSPEPHTECSEREFPLPFLTIFVHTTHKDVNTNSMGVHTHFPGMCHPSYQWQRGVHSLVRPCNHVTSL